MYYNSKRFEGPRLREGDLVYVLRRNIRTIKPNNKLNHKKIGPFKIKRNIRDISYKLHLLFTIRIYPVFHVSLLESVNPNTPTGPTLEIHSDLQEFKDEIEKILKMRKNRRQL